jgi:two-component system, chemotaxis family, response regulator Rcp1
MPIEILLVEDSPGDARLTQETFREIDPSIHLNLARDGVEAMAYLRKEDGFARSPRPDLILLDLNMPRMDGRAVLESIKENPDFRSIPTAILTTSDAQEDVTASYELQASCYLIKPVTVDSFTALVNSFATFWLKHVSLPDKPKKR